jgi:hypothetical protein
MSRARLILLLANLALFAAFLAKFVPPGRKPTWSDGD